MSRIATGERAGGVSNVSRLMAWFVGEDREVWTQISDKKSVCVAKETEGCSTYWKGCRFEMSRVDNKTCDPAYRKEREKVVRSE